jgi:hypothetical protein
MRGVDALVRAVRGRCPRSRTGRWLAAIAFVLLAAGCLRTFDPRGLGNECVLDSSAAAAGPTATAVSVDPASCGSTVCLRPAQQKTTDTVALCTEACQTDADCSGGQLRDPQDPEDRRCQTGFSCQMPIPNLSAVTLSCQKVCVCRDFLSSTTLTGHPKAAGCP